MEENLANLESVPEECAYPPCICLGEGESLFCSDFCRKHSSGQEGISYTCGCSHESCRVGADREK